MIRLGYKARMMSFQSHDYGALYKTLDLSEFFSSVA